MEDIMNQVKSKNVAQVFYNNRWVDREHFAAFVYKESEQKLAKSYKEYEDLLATGLWFNDKAKAMEAKKPILQEAPKSVVLDLKKDQARKPKDGADS